MGLKELIFNKGGIGVSMSRAETVEHLNPLIEQHMALNHAYNYAIGHLSEPELVEPLADFQKVARVDVGKLMETVFSCGGVAYNGVDMEAADYALSAGDDAMLYDLLDQEQAFLHALDEELDLPHQLRTQAVLKMLRSNSQQRVDFLKENTKKRRRPTAAV